MSEPNSMSFEARVEASTLDRAYVVVDTDFAEKLTTEHSRTFEARATETPAGVESFTRDVPNAGERALEGLDDRGVIRIGCGVSPGVILVGKIAPRGGGPASPEEKLLRAIFGEAVGDAVDTSLRAPPGCFGAVSGVEVDVQGTMVRVTVEWTRPLDVGDVLEVNGQPAVVSEVRALGADIAWSGGASTASVQKIAMARDVLHARSIGPYDQSTQQPTIGRERFGGQVLEIEQVEILGANAPWTLWEAFTIKADGIAGRTRAYESLVKRENPAKDLVPASAPPAGNDIFSFFEAPASLPPGSVPCVTPEAVNLLAAHLRALGFDVRFDTEEVGASLTTADEVRQQSHGQVGTGELFSQRVFGPVADYRCECGKYARMKYRGVVCESCGVEVLQSRVRRERFGHVELEQPLVHPHFRHEVATLLEMSPAELDPMVEGEGGRAIRDRLAALDLEAIDATETGPRADLATVLVDAAIPATALMLETVVVLPPDLRPPSSPIADAYERFLESRSQSALDELFERLSSLADSLWRDNVFTKPVDYSGIAALTVDPSLAPGECRVPRAMISELFKPFAYGILEEQGYVVTIKSAKRMVEQGALEAIRCLDEASTGYPLLLASGSRLLVRTVRAWEAPAIAVDPETARRLDARTVVVHVPLTHEAALECSRMEDLPYKHLRASRGWLSRAVGGGLLAEVRDAVLKMERDRIDDPVLQCALGRMPSPMSDVELERWKSERTAAQSALRETFEEATEERGPDPTFDRLVDELELSVSTANALANAGIQTVGELCGRTEAELLKTRGIERRSLAELRELLAEMNLSLGMRIP